MIIDLLERFYMIGVKTTKEVNSKRGLTKRTIKEEEKIVEEISNLLNINKEELLKRIRN